MSEVATETDDVEAKPEGESIAIRCLSCGRTATLARDDSRVSDAPVVTLTRRLRCSACGSRAVRAQVVATPRDIARRLRARMDGAR